MNNLVDYEVVIIGAGAVGLAVAKDLQENNFKSVIVLDKNNNFGQETSSRNSQVIHSGSFNDLTSEKFKFCVEGKYLVYDFFE